MRAPDAWYRSAACWLLLAIAAVGALAPLLANDVPLLARRAGQWQFPALADLFGAPPVGPGDLTWKQWWARLPPDGADFAWMPPWPYGPNEADPWQAGLPPCWLHPLGRDDTGRDVLARLLHGAGSAVALALPAVLLGGIVGSLLGAWAALRRGWADIVVLRLIELFACFPMLLFLLFAAAFFGASHWALVLVLASLFWTSFARIVRGELLGLRDLDFVHTARGLGVSETRILFAHLLPLLGSRIGTTAAFCAAAAIVAEATLAYLQLGPGGASSSWGTMLRQGSEQALVGAWHLWCFPAAAIVATVLCCHVLADRLRNTDGT